MCGNIHFYFDQPLNKMFNSFQKENNLLNSYPLYRAKT